MDCNYSIPVNAIIEIGYITQITLRLPCIFRINVIVDLLRNLQLVLPEVYKCRCDLKYNDLVII